MSSDTNEPLRGWTSERGAAAYTGYSIFQFRRLVEQGVFKRGTQLTPNGRRRYRFADLDAAHDRATRSRKPKLKQEPRGIVRQRLEQEASR
jgi:hypothetical protein